MNVSPSLLPKHQPIDVCTPSHHLVSMPRKPKPPPDDPEQSKRFIDAAREIGADERPEAFERVFAQVTSKARRRKGPKGDSAPLIPQSLQTVSILETQLLITEDRTIALALKTDHLGTIAFVVSLETIALLQKQLAQAEEFLRSRTSP